MIESPPKVALSEIKKYAFRNVVDKEIINLIEKINDKYEYWSDVKYKVLPETIKSHYELWCRVKLSRQLKNIVLWEKYGVNTAITNYMQRMCHDFDMNFGGSWGTGSILDDGNKEQYLVSSLMEEAISSSKMEGASTTRKLAKDMLRNKMKPKDKSQQMIFNNYNTIRFIAENKNEPLSEDLLLRIHSSMTEKTLDNAMDAGRFRVDDNVVVENGITHETVHTPPLCCEIASFIDTLCKFVNEDNDEVFIHPIIKGIIIHFMIGYMHPFADGNGRTARALFYWYMLKKGYWLTEYLSISRVISKTKNSYEKAYLFSEYDHNDIGYFITYNLTVLDRAFKELKLYINRKIEEKRIASDLIIKLKDLNERQAQIIKIFINDHKKVLTVKEVEIRCGVVPATAKRDIIGLLNRGILTEVAFNKVKKGYIRSDDFDNIISNN